jgi:DNA modification methylase
MNKENQHKEIEPYGKVSKYGIDLYNGDCLEVMDKLIEDGIVVDAIITDEPYGTTQCKWDSVIPFGEMWERLNKLIKPNGAIVLFGIEPFSSALRMSNIKNYKYDWVWVKRRPVGFANAKKRPLKLIENIMIFNAHYSIYKPQDLIRIDKKVTNSKSTGGDTTGAFNYGSSYTQEFTNYPKEIITQGLDEKKKSTQRKNL